MGQTCRPFSVYSADAGNGPCTAVVNYTPNSSTPPCDGPVTSIVATNAGTAAATLYLTTATQGSDTSAAHLADGTWEHRISAPVGSVTLAPGNSPARLTPAFWGITKLSDILNLAPIAA